ncbi:MAG: serine/threonine-protein kinase [Planctomycetota bacterium]
MALPSSSRYLLPLLLAAGAPANDGAPLTRLGRVGPYELLAPLGSGGMGEVHLAIERGEVLRRVALKQIRADLDDRDAERRFTLEAQALALAEHDNIARLFAHGRTSEGVAWIAMEYVDGEPLLAAADQRRLDVDARIELFLGLCDAVEHLHERGIWHRDLKPANVLVTERNDRLVPKLIDLGLANLPAFGPNAPSELSGTLSHMAPEQFRADARPDHRADVYSLGLILYELLAGSLPDLPRDARSESVSLTRRQTLSPSRRLAMNPAQETVAAERGTTVRALARRFTRGLDELVTAALAEDPNHRITSARELADGLRRERDSEQARIRTRERTLFALCAAAIGAAVTWTATLL